MGRYFLKEGVVVAEGVGVGGGGVGKGGGCIR